MVDTGTIGVGTRGIDESLLTGLGLGLVAVSTSDLGIDLVFGGTVFGLIARDGFNV
jgi:hypothetical protein